MMATGLQHLPFDEKPRQMHLQGLLHIFEVLLRRGGHHVGSDAEHAAGADPDGAHGGALDPQVHHLQRRCAEDGGHGIVARQDDEQVVQTPHHILRDHDDGPAVDRQGGKLDVHAPGEEGQFQEEEGAQRVQDLSPGLEPVVLRLRAVAPTREATRPAGARGLRDVRHEPGDVHNLFPWLLPVAVLNLIRAAVSAPRDPRSRIEKDLHLHMGLREAAIHETEAFLSARLWQNSHGMCRFLPAGLADVLLQLQLHGLVNQVM
mmetsp:Transcript_79156/g.199930  ORF Transcript_79156/g.199930 Transcript_79156/m.199930 type:complete len:261 (-) Transcript_79156:1175-1957(-)